MKYWSSVTVTWNNQTHFNYLGCYVVYKYDDALANKLHRLQYRKTANIVESNNSPGINMLVSNLDLKRGWQNRNYDSNLNHV
jgi:hypothetical protein